MNTEQKSVFDQPVKSVSLAHEWLAQEPERVKDGNGLYIGYLYGSKNFTKMKQFAERVKLDNSKIDFWMSLSQVRGAEEPYEEYKIRMKFQKHLLKYISYIYNFNNTAVTTA